MMELLLQVCISFLKVGAFAFGGGYAVLAFLQREIVEANGWIAPEAFVDIIAIAEMTPGPIAVNASTFVGYNLFGVWGGILCSLCAIAVPFVLALLVAVFFSKFKNNPKLKQALSGIRPVVVGLIAAACLSVGRAAFADLTGILFFGVALLLVWKGKLNPIVTLLICGALGGVCYGWLFPLLGI